MKSFEKAIFVAKKMFAELLYDFQALENMPFTFPEVQTYLQGITIGGHKISDQEKLKQQQEAWKKLIELVEKKEFSLDKKIVCDLQYIVALNEAIDPGKIRQGGISIAGTDYKPPEPDKLKNLLKKTIIKALNKNYSLLNRGYELHLDFAKNQFFWDGNKRSGLLMMNGLFMSNGFLPLSVPAKRLFDYNSKMIDFYNSDNILPMMEFLESCHQLMYEKFNIPFPV